MVHIILNPLELITRWMFSEWFIFFFFGKNLRTEKKCKKWDKINVFVSSARNAITVWSAYPFSTKHHVCNK